MTNADRIRSDKTLREQFKSDYYEMGANEIRFKYRIQPKDVYELRDSFGLKPRRHKYDRGIWADIFPKKYDPCVFNFRILNAVWERAFK